MERNKLTTKPKKRGRIILLFIISLIFVGIAASIGVVGCSYIENRNFKETFYNVSSLKVNNKMRILQISDLHNCTFGKNNVDLIERVEKLKPDVILLTGDCIDSKDTSNEKMVSLCTAFTKVAPTYYIYGNNEVEKYYDTQLTQKELDKKYGFDNSTRDPQKLLDESDIFTEKLKQAGVKVLKNSADTIVIGTTKVDIYGVLTSNPSAFWSYAGGTFNDYLYTNENNFKLTAIHEPLIFEEFEPDFWGDLLLAGHTHGGLAKIPIIGPLYPPEGGLLPARGGHYVYGRYEVQGRPLIVSSGLENTNYLRINNEPEIVIVDVNKF